MLALDNVTLTSHIAGTTREALTRSPELLVNEVVNLLEGRKAAVKNPEVLERPKVQAWLREAAAALGRGARDGQ
ncbi:hypothetical protein [Alicyclobacillus macrosporangiidus]|uniref:hypothetical protein n=1 Tax=Alicyclobacillus macrosporangiidus TaxID=392015 RepID=UPI0018CC50E4|nr:hypothetical protein [Alicyclobacillus macrosporangiidus]